MIVDDDRFILELVKTVLQKEGHETQLHLNAYSALQSLELDDSFDLIITDVVMPGKDGAELAQQIKTRDPSKRILAITGGIENAVEDYMNFADMFTDETLSKPFNPADLMSAVNRVTA